MVKALLLELVILLDRKAAVLVTVWTEKGNVSDFGFHHFETFLQFRGMLEIYPNNNIFKRNFGGGWYILIIHVARTSR